MYIHRCFSIALIFFCMIYSFSFQSYAGDSCSISSVQDPVATPPLCRGKSVNALLSATTSQPDFSNVTDILQGERNLLQVDDLVIQNPTSKLEDVATPFSNTFRNYMAFTEDKEVTNTTRPDIIAVSDNCNTNNGGDLGPTVYPYGSPSAQQTNAVRMFNLDRDLIVTFSLKEGSLCAVFSSSITIQDPLGILSIPVLDLSGNYAQRPVFTHSAVGDFNNDGYEDILIIKGGTRPGMFVISAVDPDDPGLGVMLGPYRNFPKVGDIFFIITIKSYVVSCNWRLQWRYYN